MCRGATPGSIVAISIVVGVLAGMAVPGVQAPLSSEAWAGAQALAAAWELDAACSSEQQGSRAHC